MGGGGVSFEGEDGNGGKRGGATVLKAEGGEGGRGD